VHLANPAAIRHYDGLKYSGDFADAAYLAQLLRLGVLPEGYIYPAQERQVRDLSPTGAVPDRPDPGDREPVLTPGGQMQGERVKRLDEAQVSGFGFAPDVTLAMQANLAVMQTLQEEIGIIEKRLMERVKLHPDYALLNSVPGIGPVLATTIMLETGSISRFAEVGNFSSYCRCVDSRLESNSRKKGEGNTRNGNKYLAWAFVEAANFAIRTCPEAKRFYERKKRARNRIVAIKALAHKLARACYHMLREYKPFEVARCFG